MLDERSITERLQKAASVEQNGALGKHRKFCEK
jgi:hypothetical protein